MSEHEQPAPAPDNAEELAALTAEAAEIEPGYGQPGTGEQPEPEPAGVSNADALQMVLGPLFAIAAPRWNMQQAEIEQLAIVWGEVADKYMPEGLALGVELNAAIVTLAVLGPRLSMPRNDAEAAKRSKGKTSKQQQAQAREQAEAAQKAAEARPDGDPIIDMTTGADSAET